jgi:hypothetical protein
MPGFSFWGGNRGIHTMEKVTKIFKPQPDQPPPLESMGGVGWLKEKLFSTP